MDYPNDFLPRAIQIAGLILFLAVAVNAQSDDDDENYIVPVRPSVSESANIQKKGVLQIESGADFDYRAADFRSGQTAATGVYFAATKRLRLDFEFEPFVSEKDLQQRRQSGSGDVNLGFKAVLRDQPEKKLAAAFSYTIKLPAASAEKNLGTGKVDHNLRFILDRSLGKNDYTLNVSYLNVGREMSNRRAAGAQIIARYDRKLTKKLEIINEVFGNTVDEDQPRGIYYNGALTYRLTKRVQLDAGARPGFGADAPKIGFFFGVSFGAAELYR